MELVELAVEHGGDRAEVLLALVVRDLEDEPFGALADLASGAPVEHAFDWIS